MELVGAREVAARAAEAAEEEDGLETGRGMGN